MMPEKTSTVNEDTKECGRRAGRRTAIQKRGSLPASRRYRFIAVAVFLLVSVIECLCYVGGRYLQTVRLLYNPPHPKYEHYTELFHPVFGWALFISQRSGWDAIGSRITPAFPDPEKSPALVSLYGDSWTFSENVDDEHAMGNVLSRLLGHRVNNFGEIAWGTDQAYLRFKHNRQDKARIAVLGHFSEDILRNINQYPYLLHPSVDTVFKPRFALTDTGGLRLISSPRRLAEQEFADWVCYPERHLRDDYFLPGGPTGLRRLSFPYSFSIVHAFNYLRHRAPPLGSSYWADFYRPDHPSGALGVTAAIIRAFVHDAREMGRVPIVAIYPHPFDLAYKQRHGAWPYQSLMAELDAAKIPYFEAGAFLLKVLGGRDPSEIYAPLDPEEVARHPNAEGYRLHAEALYQHIVQRGLLPPSKRGT
jgi:hypothetical protein